MSRINVDYVENIRQSGLTIYDPIQVGDNRLWIPTDILQSLLDDALRGKRVGELPLRTRSKFIKQMVCDVLGYPTPKAFAKTQPRFLGQQFDTYFQQSDNVQVWNEELSPTRRYAIFRISSEFVISEVKVILGADLVVLDKTGKLTRKYQAICKIREDASELVSESDTTNLSPICNDKHVIGPQDSPVAFPEAHKLLPIAVIYKLLQPLLEIGFEDAGVTQDRNRGAGLHRLVCKALGYTNYSDNGGFPDVLNQLLEVKLQTSQTVDLGLCLPSDPAELDINIMAGRSARICDVRYAIFYAKTDGKVVSLTHLLLVTGESFFGRFPQCEGQKMSKKLQIPLPRGFFSTDTESTPN